MNIRANYTDKKLKHTPVLCVSVAAAAAAVAVAGGIKHNIAETGRWKRFKFGTSLKWNHEILVVIGYL